MDKNSEIYEGMDAVRRLRRLDACAISDALDKLGLKGVLNGVPRQSGEGRIAGRVITVKLGMGQPPSGAARHHRGERRRRQPERSLASIGH